MKQKDGIDVIKMKIDDSRIDFVNIPHFGDSVSIASPDKINHISSIEYT